MIVASPYPSAILVLAAVRFNAVFVIAVDGLSGINSPFMACELE